MNPISPMNPEPSLVGERGVEPLPSTLPPAALPRKAAYAHAPATPSLFFYTTKKLIHYGLCSRTTIPKTKKKISLDLLVIN